MFCENCGNAVKETSKFCSKCGTKVDPIAAEEVEITPPIESDQPDYEEIRNHTLEGRLAIFLLRAAGSLDAWFPDGSGAEFEFEDGVKVTTRNGGVPINDKVLQLYDDYLTDWRVPSLDGVPFTDRRILSVLKKRPSLWLQNWRVNFSAILPNQDDGVECDAYLVSTNDEEGRLIGLGGSIGDNISEELLAAWLEDAEQNNWMPRRPGEVKRSAVEFLSSRIDREQQGSVLTKPSLHAKNASEVGADIGCEDDGLHSTFGANVEAFKEPETRLEKGGDMQVAIQLGILNGVTGFEAESEKFIFSLNKSHDEELAYHLEEFSRNPNLKSLAFIVRYFLKGLGEPDDPSRARSQNQKNLSEQQISRFEEAMGNVHGHLGGAFYEVYLVGLEIEGLRWTRADTEVFEGYEGIFGNMVVSNDPVTSARDGSSIEADWENIDQYA